MVIIVIGNSLLIVIFLMHPDLMTVWHLYHPYVRSYKFCRGYLISACAFQIVKNIESNWMLTLYPEQF